MEKTSFPPQSLPEFGCILTETHPRDRNQRGSSRARPPRHDLRQFFTHMASADSAYSSPIALEQAVEKAHERHEMKEVGEALRVKLEKNILLAREASIESRREHAIYLGDFQALQYLKAHPGEKLTELPAPIFWTAYDYGQETTAWKNAVAGHHHLVPSGSFAERCPLFSLRGQPHSW